MELEQKFMMICQLEIMGDMGLLYFIFPRDHEIDTSGIGIGAFT